jgi:hypothetical protein
MHLRSGTSLRIDHWIEILDEKLRQADEQAQAEPQPAEIAL